METFIKADIFFTITSATVVLLSLAAIVALIYLIMILHELRQLMRRIREEGEHIMDDVGGIREAIENQGWKVKDFIDSIGYSVLRFLRVFFSNHRRGKE